MFLEYLEEFPNHPRATFYLAQTYESIDQAKAIEWYEKRVQLLHGWIDEAYIACLRLGRLYKNYSDKVKWWMHGTYLVPHRLECYHELMMQEYHRGKHLLAVGFGMMSTQFSRIPIEHDLFIEPDVYNFLLDLHLGVSCYWTKNWKEGIDACQRALKTCPEWAKPQLKENLNFLNQIKPLDYLPVADPTPAYFNTITKIENKDRPTHNLIIIDNFYDNPMEMRNKALSMDFNVTGNFPGSRTAPYLTEGIKERFERILGKRINHWPSQYNGSFQIATNQHSSWIHRDTTDWSVVVFLTPNAPVDSGTMFYRHKETGLECTFSQEDEDRLNNDSRNYDQWELVDKIGNKFNRCVMFRGRR